MIFEKVKNIMMDIMGIPEDELLLQSHLYDELDADSLDLSQIIVELENAYQIEIENEDIANFEKVEDIVKHVENKINE
ncbi:acyl carrier protein [Marinisporobacter balticus]|uniref:Acyl carrier protein n=1 Tax=Marinisporobacter balticus TaxID=2018667 RepID=A0A4V2SAN0_9FIRM|nr:acyl carrier protein [Marinisporobacter balticus]TCO72270.1 acyl carrier protein [Marinisporobacter balticus]